jgi:hypothetical protein
MSLISRLTGLLPRPLQPKVKPSAANGKPAEQVKPAECLEAEKLVAQNDFQGAVELLANAADSYADLLMIQEASLCLVAIKSTVIAAKGTVGMPSDIVPLYQKLILKP